MIDYETYAKIHHYANVDLLSIQQISEALNLSWHTVESWLKESHYCQREPRNRVSKLDPFKAYIQRELEKHNYSAVQIYQQIRNMTYSGGYWIVKEYIRKIRPPRNTAYLTLNFAPAECAQVDWGEWGSIQIGSTKRKLSYFVMVLSYSRMVYIEFTVRQTMEHFLTCHQNAFSFFGGTPSYIMIDNLRSGVLRHLVGEAPVFNPRYLDFARHYSFDIKACAPRKGNEKGRVECGVQYVQKNLLNGLELPPFAAMGPIAREWMDNIANVRLHGETKERPIDRFQKEKSLLTPLPVMPYDSSQIHSVRATSRFRVHFDSNRYSVPAKFAGAIVTLKANPDSLYFYHEDKLIARHARCYDKNQDFEDPDHPMVLIEQRKSARDQILYGQFLRLSPDAEQYYIQLRERLLNPRTHMNKILALADIYGKEATARAIKDAITAHAFSSQYILNILEIRARKLPEISPLILTEKQDLLDIELPEPDLSLYCK